MESWPLLLQLVQVLAQDLAQVLEMVQVLAQALALVLEELPLGLAQQFPSEAQGPRLPSLVQLQISQQE